MSGTLKHLPKLLVLAAILMAIEKTASAATNCSVHTTGNQVGINFGAYDSLGTLNQDTLGSITIKCVGQKGTTNYQISLTAGNGAFSSRRLLSGSSVLNYNLYTEPTRSVVWGNGNSGTATISGSLTIAGGQGQDTGTATAVHTIYGRIFGGQHSIQAGSYTDNNIIVSVNY